MNGNWFNMRLLAAALAIWLPCGVAYACTFSFDGNNPIVSFQPSLSGPSSGYPPGSAIGGFVVGTPNWGWVGDQCSGLQYRVTINPVSSQVPGVQYVENGVTYPVYDTTVPGIGYAAATRTVGSANWLPLTANLDAGVFANGKTVNWEMRGVLVATGPIKSGTYPFRLKMMEFRGVSTVDGRSVFSPIISGIISGTVTVAARVCKVVDGANSIVNLPAVTATSFNGVGSLSSQAAERFAITLDCEEDVRVHATMTDASDPANTTDILTLAPGSTASGVGIQVLRDNGTTPVNFGPDSANAGNPNQWYIATTPLGGARVDVPFVARYAQSGAKVSVGSVMARSTITFSYQ